MGSNGPRSNPASPPSSNITAATTIQQPRQLELEQEHLQHNHHADTTSEYPVIMEKSQTFPPSRQAGRSRKSHEAHRQTTASTSPPPNGSECPPYGSKSVIGRRAKMEDAFKAVPNLLQVPLHREADELLPPRLAPQLRSSSSSSRNSAETSAAATAAAAVPPPQITTVSGSENQQAVSTTTAGSLYTAQTGTGALTINPQVAEESSVEVLHFFGVFDGHGGADAAMHCAKTLHERVKQVLSSVTSPTGGSGNLGHANSPNNQSGEEQGEEGEQQNRLRGGNSAAAAAEEEGGVESSSTSEGATTDVPLSSAFESGSIEIDYMDASEGGGNENDDDDGGDDDGGSGLLRPGAARLSHAASIEGLPCTTETVEAALTKAFHLTDEEFGEMGGYEHLALVGTTAVVALIGGRMIYVANCGDSRAVLCRDGQAIALTDDHKAAREDETARVEAAGGQILFWNGVRVMGLLAVSRAIGDHSLRPYVIAEPEVTIVNRNLDDELLIMASDGLWDVMSNQEACNLAKKCLLRARQRGSTRHSAAKVAATVLTRAAVDRGSRDNVTVVIVDLTSHLDGDIEGDREDTSAPLPSRKPSLRDSEGLDSSNLPPNTSWDNNNSRNGSGGAGRDEEKIPSSSAGNGGGNGGGGGGGATAGAGAPPSPFDLPMAGGGSTSSGAPLPQSEGAATQPAIHPRGSIPMTSPFSTGD
jgi:serine/threonine protein phosphatase PrpC